MLQTASPFVRAEPQRNFLARMVDDLAATKAQIAELQEHESVLKQALVATGLEAIEGTLHRATVSHCEGKVTVDWAAIAAKLEPSRQLVAAHTSQGRPFDVVRVSSKRVN
jgi:hypothetical protein